MELLIVLAIFSLIATLAIPTANHAAARQIAREQVSAGLHRARAEAIASGEPMGLLIAAKDASGGRRRYAIARAIATDSDSQVFHPLNRWRVLPEPFHFLTTVTPPNARFHLSDGTEVSAILFAPSGKVLAPNDHEEPSLIIAPAARGSGHTFRPIGPAEQLRIHRIIGTCTWTAEL